MGLTSWSVKTACCPPVCLTLLPESPAARCCTKVIRAGKALPLT